MLGRFPMKIHSLRPVLVGLITVLGASCSSPSDHDGGESSVPADGLTPPSAPPPSFAAPSGMAGEKPPLATSGGEAMAPTDAPLVPGDAPPGDAPETAEEPSAPPLEGDIRFSEPSGTFQGTLSV